MGAKLKHDIGTAGANAEYAAHEVKDWRQSQKKSVVEAGQRRSHYGG